MFDIGWGELLVIGMVALIAIGPKELPAALRTMGQWMHKIRRMAGEFQNQFSEAMREAELADLKKEVEEMASTASKVTSFDPLEQTRKEVESAMGAFPDSPSASASNATPTTTSSADVGAVIEPIQSQLVLGPPTGEAPPAVPGSHEAAPAAQPSVSASVEAKPDAGTGSGVGGRA